MKIEDFGHFCGGACISGSIGACAGYCFAIASDANPRLTAQLLAVASIAAFTFNVLVENNPYLGYKDKHFVYALGIGFGGWAVSINLYKLGIISTFGGQIPILTIAGLVGREIGTALS